ncbi:MAG TPA: hypothetical protein VHZ24_21580 [Pirellulales bacterium]|nr:hypothetical protein [Pirellulales bacterium]
MLYSSIKPTQQNLLHGTEGVPDHTRPGLYSVPDEEGEYDFFYVDPTFSGVPAEHPEAVRNDSQKESR